MDAMEWFIIATILLLPTIVAMNIMSLMLAMRFFPFAHLRPIDEGVAHSVVGSSRIRMSAMILLTYALVAPPGLTMMFILLQRVDIFLGVIVPGSQWVPVFVLWYILQTRAGSKASMD